MFVAEAAWMIYCRPIMAHVLRVFFSKALSEVHDQEWIRELGRMTSNQLTRGLVDLISYSHTFDHFTTLLE